MTLRDYSDFDPNNDSHYRLCAKKDEGAWRLRDERTEQLWIVDDYKGEKNIKWMDNGSHVFHDGKIDIIDGVAHFKDS